MDRIIICLIIVIGLSLCSGCTSENGDNKTAFNVTENLNAQETSFSAKQEANLTSAQQKLDLETAYALAESYAKAKYPDFWETSPKRSVKNFSRGGSVAAGMRSDYSFGWREVFYYPDINTVGHFEIDGPGSISIIMYDTGGIRLENFNNPYDLDNGSLNLCPDITEDEAWDIAEAYYEEQGVSDILPSEITSRGLHILSGSSLGWIFIVEHNYPEMEGILIDAHDGHIISVEVL